MAGGTGNSFARGGPGSSGRCTATLVLPAYGALDVSWTVDLTGKRDMIVLLEAIAPAVGEAPAGAAAKPGRDIHFWQVTSASPPPGRTSTFHCCRSVTTG